MRANAFILIELLLPAVGRSLSQPAPLDSVAELLLRQVPVVPPVDVSPEMTEARPDTPGCSWDGRRTDQIATGPGRGGAVGRRHPHLARY